MRTRASCPGLCSPNVLLLMGLLGKLTLNLLCFKGMTQVQAVGSWE